MQSSERQNIEYFSEHAAEYDSKYDLSVAQNVPKAHFIFSNSTRKISQGRILELGCGTGNLAMAMVQEELATSFIGLDISHAMVSVAQEKLGRGSGAAFLTASALKLPFADEAFDLVVGDAFLHHILHVSDCVDEVWRVLKPGGCATFNEPHREGFGLLEFLLRVVATTTNSEDRNLEDYIYFLQYLRENEGNLEALESLPLPDKHFFSEGKLKRIVERSQFVESHSVRGRDYYPGLWQDTVRSIMSIVKPEEPLLEYINRSSVILDDTLGPLNFQHYCLHLQFYLYKD